MTQPRYTKKELKAIREMSKEDQLEIINKRLHEDADRWKQYAAESEFGFHDLLSRLNDSFVLRPPQK